MSQQTITDRVPIRGIVTFDFYDNDGNLVEHIEHRNLVTDDGKRFYAYRAAAETPADEYFVATGTATFDGVIELYKGATNTPAVDGDRSGIGGTAVIVTGAATTKIMDTGYPKRDDDDVNNQNAGPNTITYKVTFSNAEALDSGINTAVITNPTPGASEKLLMWSKFSDKTHTSGGTMVVRINHPIG